MFRHLAEEEIVFQKGDIIISQGEKTKYLYFLESGSCYRSIITDKGDNVIYEIKEAGYSIDSLVGVLTAYNYAGESYFTFKARTVCKCLKISVKNFNKWVMENSEHIKELVNLAPEKSKDVREAFQAFQEGRVANRFCHILLSCSQTIEGKLIINNKYTVTEMAAMLGVHQVTVSRILHALSEEKVLKRIRQGFLVLDYQKLYAYANKEKVLTYR